MQVDYRLADVIAPPEGVVLTIGNFDGVHRGHVRLVETAQAVARRLGAAVIAMTFHPHPLAVLAPERAPAQLTNLRERLLLLERQGVEHAVVLRSTPDFLAQEAPDFLASLVAHCRPRAFVEGPDFSFGKGRAGDVDTLRAHADQWGYEVHVEPVVHCAELPTHPTISSSSIRQALVDGRVDAAALMLGRPYRIVGRVGHGEGRGAGLGFPTANLEHIAHPLPQEAVYAAIAQRADSRLDLAAVNIGPQPTFEQQQSRVEAHLLDVQDDLRGQRLGLHFLVRLREQQKFSGPEELIAQLHRDVAATREHLPQLDKLRQVEPIAL